MWADQHGIPKGAGSDAHGWHGWGRTYCVVAEAPTAANLKQQLQAGAIHYTHPSFRGVLYPKFNRLKGRIHHA
jgi:hypothetical protein